MKFSKNACLSLACVVSAVALRCAAVDSMNVVFVGSSFDSQSQNSGLSLTNHCSTANGDKCHDYVHLVAQGLERQTGRRVTAHEVDSHNLEFKYAEGSVSCDPIQEALSYKPEIAILAIGENLGSLSNEVNFVAYARSCRRAVSALKYGGVRVVLRTPCCTKDRMRAMLKKLADKESVLYVDCSDLGQNPGGNVKGALALKNGCSCPSSANMPRVADRVLAALAPQKIVYPDRVVKWPRQLKGMMLPPNPSEKDFSDLAKMGANLVRYQMLGPDEERNKQHRVSGGYARYDAWVDNRLDLLQRMLPWGRKYGIMICVDNHFLPGGNTDEQYQGSLMFQQEKYCDWVVDMWRKTARRMRGNWDVIYGYDIINEPMDRESADYETCWRALFSRCCDVIRNEDPDATIVVEPNCHASPYGFEVDSHYKLRGFAQLPYDNVIYQLHMYLPLDYSGQGLFAAPDVYKPIEYPNEAKGWDKNWLRHELRAVRQFQLETGARIYVGEFSAVAYAPGAAQYLRDLTDIFQEYGWDWTYHAFRESNCWSIEHEGRSFHQLKPSEKETERARVLKVAISGRK